MHKIALFLIFLAPAAFANYNVGQPLAHQPETCGVLLYTGSADNVPNHPILRMPEAIQLLLGEEKVDFNYQGWHRSWDSIVSLFVSESGEKLIHDDACFENMNLVACLSFRGCRYRVNAL